MLSPASKLLLALMVAALGTALAYQVVVDERAGLVLFVFLAAAALAAAVATAGAAVPDQAPVVPKDAPPPERRATTTGSPARGSGWPAFAAVAVGVLAATAAAGGPGVIAGVVLVVAAAVGWFGTVWAEDPQWTPRLRERLRFRLVVPAALPAAMFLIAATIAVSVSRILLAVSKDSSVAVALVVALVILGACAFVATRPRVTSSAIMAMVAVGAVATIGIGITGVSAGEREFHPHEHEGVVELRAKNVKYSTDKITVKAGEEVSIEFHNGDAGTYHNMAVYEGDSPDAAPVFNGEGFPGDKTKVYRFTAPAAGAYVFVCDFHPNMKGTFVTK